MKINLLILLIGVILSSHGVNETILTDTSDSLQIHASEHISHIEPEEEIILWQLVAIKGREVRYADDQEPITLQFNAEAGTVCGNSGCNRYFGNYTLVPASPSKGLPNLQKVTISHLGATKMACPEAFMQLEQQYLPLLEKANRMQLIDNELILYQNSKEILRYDYLVR